MRAIACALLATSLIATSAAAQSGRAGAPFWKTVQTTCDAAARRPPSETGKRIARTAIDEFNRFGGHRIDSNGRLFHFGLTEAENEEDDGGGPQANVGELGWWMVMKYWRSLYGSEAPSKLEVRGYKDASTATQESQVAMLLRTSAAQLLAAADAVTDPATREVLRQAALRGAAVDTSWSAAFVSYVIRQSGVSPAAFQFSNAHRAYIYDAFLAAKSELTQQAGDKLYRACPLSSTRPRPGDLLCQQRESSLADAGEVAVRERILGELDGKPEARTIRRTHCEVVAHVDARRRKMYTIGGNVNQSVTARQLSLKRGLRFAAVQKANCGGHNAWTLPPASDAKPGGPPSKCSLNDKKWFVLLQLR